SIGSAAEMLVEQSMDGTCVQILVDERAVVDQGTAHELDALSLEPARIWRGETLLLRPGHLLRNQAIHDVAQDLLAVARPLEEAGRLVARLVLVDPRDLVEAVKLHSDRHAHGEIDQIVVEER